MLNVVTAIGGRWIVTQYPRPGNQSQMLYNLAKQTEPYLGVEVATYSLLSPWLKVELCSPLFFWVSNYISHCLHGT